MKTSLGLNKIASEQLNEIVKLNKKNNQHPQTKGSIVEVLIKKEHKRVNKN